MKRILPLVLSSGLLLVLGCKEETSKQEPFINKQTLLLDIKIISSDSMEGRLFGSKGNLKTRDYISRKFDSLRISQMFGDSYLQEFTHTFKAEEQRELHDADSNLQPKDTIVTGGNVIGVIKGQSDKSFIITAHIDHLGILNGEIYNGADDDASGLAALLAIANYFKDKNPKHNLILAAVDAEEIGSLGAEYLASHIPIDLKNLVLNISMDMIAHNDNRQLYAAGTSHYPQLKPALVNLKSPYIELLFGHDDPNDFNLDDWTFSSDHRVFHQRNIPFVYFGVEDHDDYHRPTDTFENINQEFYANSVELIIQAIKNFDDYL